VANGWQDVDREAQLDHLNLEASCSRRHEDLIAAQHVQAFIVDLLAGGQQTTSIEAALLLEVNLITLTYPALRQEERAVDHIP
jgi:hypothetical protein